MGAKEIVDDFFDYLDVITDEYKNEVITDDKKVKVTDHGKAFFAAKGWEVVE
jgi:hypothetical protein